MNEIQIKLLKYLESQPAGSYIEIREEFKAEGNARLLLLTGHLDRKITRAGQVFRITQKGLNYLKDNGK